MAATQQGMQYRRRSREIALQVLYSIAEGNTSYVDTFELFAHEPAAVQEYALRLVKGVQKYQDQILADLGKCVQHWSLDRIAVVERVVLSIAIYEMKYERPPVQTGAAVNEAVELAKEFSGAESGNFVNGVLHAVGGMAE